MSQLVRFEFAIVASPAIGANDFRELVAWLKANTAKASYGTPGSGNIPHFLGWRLEQVLGLSMTRVPYRGSALIVNDLIGGHVPFGITTVADAIAQHRAGAVKILAVSSTERSQFVADVPTLKESGIDLVADAWYGMWLPAGSSQEFAGKLSAAVDSRACEARGQGEAVGNRTDPGRLNAGGTDERARRNAAFWQPIVKATGYKITN